MKQNDLPIIGIIPAGGVAKRLGKLPCSKELLPISPMGQGPTPIGTLLVSNLIKGGAEEITWIIRNGKWDIPNYFGSGNAHGVSMNYNIMEYPYGPPFTLFEAYKQFRNKIVLLGFPDILLDHPNPFSPLVDELQNEDFDVALGVVSTDEPQKVDIVKMSEDSRIESIIPKPDSDSIKDAWIWAAWKPKFSDYLYHSINKKLAALKNNEDEEILVKETHIGHILQNFIESGGAIKGVKFPETKFLDIGTSNGWNKIEHFKLP